MFYGLLVHLGRNLWEGPNEVADHVRFDESMWRGLTEHMGETGVNGIVLDLGEAMFYPSHPELAVKGTWSPEKMRKELARLRAMGIEPIPKLNFSSTHDPWLKDYARMVSTDEYYRVASDVIRDACEIFDHPRFVHLGWDEEKPRAQRGDQLMIVRQGGLWWHDMVFTAKEAEKHGARGWIWSDREWLRKDEFMARCPRSIVQSQWYYKADFSDACARRNDEKMRAAPFAEPWTLCTYRELEEGGFDQIACGSNYQTPDNFPGLVQYARKTISPKHLLGFLNTVWCPLTAGSDGRGGGEPDYYKRHIQAVDQLAAAKRVCGA